MMTNKIKNIALVLSTLVLASCMSKLQGGTVTKPVQEVKVQTPIIPKKPALDESRPVDVAPLVSNYIAARLSEGEGRTKDAAFFYDKAEMADPQNKELRDRAFAMQLALGNMEEAVRIGKTVAKADDAMPISFILLMANAVKNDNLDQAMYYLNKSKKVSAELLQFHVLDAYIGLEQGEDVHKLVQNINKLPRMLGLGAIKHYHLGRLYEKAGLFVEAQKEFEIAFETDSGSSFTALALERVYELTNQPDKVQNVFDLFIKANPDNVMLLSSINRVKQGKIYIPKKESLKEDVSNVVFEISTLMSSQKLVTAAMQVINISSMLDPNNAFVTFYKGVLNEQTGFYLEAVENYKSIPKNDNTWYGAQIRMADLLSKQGNIEEAIKVAENVNKNVDINVVKRVLGELYYKGEKYKEAIEIYDKLLKEQKEVSKAEDFWMYFARGTAYERLSKYKEAERDLRESIRIMPNNAVALNYLGYMWLERDQHINEAHALIGRALLIKPKDASILDSMGWVLYKKGEFDKAAVYLEQAIEYLPTDSTINMHLGDVYEKLERFDEANLHWKRALKLKPETEKDTNHIKMKLNKTSVKLK